MESKKVEFCGI